ncbi:MAG: low-specificity L-threonine aldolase [Desulfobulbaceae bacterium]|uniref:Low-specificity L-threonine aldolase n=1 Tax=Candidatus Desulfatifera sulfidica TaxID=2841691 RepID=A0A8J6NAR4_9BACT|nr:low-specificity L-threonine aldolase [Candidatus Desulfatifera sulfidica]
MKYIDLRSDTVTQPSPAMRQVMASAAVGDDVYGEDPTVNRLELLAAEILGMEDALFAPSGTQANLLALLSHCERGDEYIVGQLAHTYKYEGGGAAVLGSIQPQPINLEDDGTLDLDNVSRVIKPDNFHFARTRLLCLENTQAGKALPLEYLHEASVLAQAHQLNMHLDGARIFNAALHCNVPVQEISRHFDSVSICLSKGLGAPVGSLLCANKDLIRRARRWRKMLGGGMRQAGILAAAGIYALNQNISRLVDDHANATLLADGLAKINGIEVQSNGTQTNMVFIEMSHEDAQHIAKFMAKHHILIEGGKTIRLVTHMDISENDIHTVTEAFRQFFQKQVGQ